MPLLQSFEEERVTRSHSDSWLYGRPGGAVLGEQPQRGHQFWGRATTSCCRQSPDFKPTSGVQFRWNPFCVDLAFQAPRPYRPGYSESEGTSDDSCYRPRPPRSFRLSPSPHPEVNDMHYAHHPIQVPCVEIPQQSSSLSGFQRGFIQAKLKTLTSFFSCMGQLWIWSSLSAACSDITITALSYFVRSRHEWLWISFSVDCRHI